MRQIQYDTKQRNRKKNNKNKNNAHDTKQNTMTMK